MKTDGELLKEIRAHFNMNQTEIAKRLGIAQGSVSAIENGTNSMGIKILGALVQELGINPGFFIKDDEPMFKQEADIKALTDQIKKLTTQIKRYERIIDKLLNK